MTRKPCILVVDDEAAMRESLKDWLVEDDYQVGVAASGVDALTMAGERNWEVILLVSRLEDAGHRIARLPGLTEADPQEPAQTAARLVGAGIGSGLAEEQEASPENPEERSQCYEE